MSTIKQLLRRGVKWADRTVEMKRVQADGDYESDWFDITPFVRRFGTTKKSFGDHIFLGETQIDPFMISLDNRARRFNRETDYGSYFKDYLTRHRTKFKISANFIDDDDSLVSGLSYYGILFSSPDHSDDGTIDFTIATMLKVFQQYPASGISTSGSPDTETLIDRLLTKSLNGVRLFDRYFEGASDAARYQTNPDAKAVTTISSPAIADDDSIWDAIVRYSIMDDFFIYIDSSGNSVWDKKDETSSEIWQFHGAGSTDVDYGINIIDISERDGLENLWTRVAIEYDDDTFSVAETSWTPGDLSDRDKYGERTFSKTFKELSSGEASTVASTILSRYESIKREWDVTTIFTPQLELKDKVSLTYVGEDTTEPTFIMGVSLFAGPDLLGGQSGSINVSNVSCMIISIEHDLDNFMSRFLLREV